MKKNIFLLLVSATVLIIAGCSSMDYKKTKSGLLYKIIQSGNSKDSVAKENQYLKFNFTTKLNDSVLQSSYGKLPGYSVVPPAAQANYSPDEIFGMVRKGDSAVTVMLVDTLLKRGLANQLPPTVKKGDRIMTTFKVLEVFRTRELVTADYDAEMKKDLPRQQKEMAEQMAKEKAFRDEQAAKDEEEMRKSGEIDRELKAMESYLATKKISAQKTGKGTFVLVKESGNGPSINLGDTVSVKYTGRILANDSVFQADSYTFPIGTRAVIPGWDEGIMVFKKGGKGTLFIPGFLAYGKAARPPFKAFEALIFDVEVLDVKPATGNH